MGRLATLRARGFRAGGRTVALGPSTSTAPRSSRSAASWSTARPPASAPTLLEISQSDASRLVLDMAGVDFLDSSGISLLIQAKQRFDAQGSVFVLRRPQSRVTRVLEVAGVADLFTIET